MLFTLARLVAIVSNQLLFSLKSLCNNNNQLIEELKVLDPRRGHIRLASDHNSNMVDEEPGALINYFKLRIRLT